MSHSLSETEAEQLRALVAELWEQFKGDNLERVGVLERAARDLEAGRLTREACLEAAQTSHKLGGAVGSFGFLQSSLAAKELETLFRRWPDLTPTQVRRIVELVQPMRADLER